MGGSIVFNPYAVPQLLVAVFMLLQGLVVLIQNPRSALNRSYFFWELAVFVWLSGMGLSYLFTDVEIVHNLFLFGFLGVIYIPIATYAFSVFFSGDKRQYFLLILGLATTVAISLFLRTDLIDKGVYHYAWGYYIRLGFFGYLTGALYFIFVPLFCRNYYLKRQVVSAEKKQWYRSTSIVGGLAFLGAADFLPGFGLALPFPPFGYIFVGVFATLMGFIILRHRLIDIKLVIGRTVGYSVMTLILLLIYGSIYYLISPKNFSGLGLAAQLTTFIVLLYGLGFLKSRSQKIVDELFFKEKIQMERMIREFIAKARDLHDINSLTQFLFSFVIDRLRVQACSVYIYESNNQRYLVTRSSSNNRKKVFYENTLYLKSAKFKNIDKQKIISQDQIVDEADPLGQVVREGKRLIGLESGSLALPLSYRDLIIGFIILGHKQSEEEYGFSEIEPLSELMGPLSITWQNSIQFDELKSVNDFNYNFITILSHQLRTPLTRIKWAVQSMNGRGFKTKADLEILKKEIASSADQVVDIIGLLLSTAETSRDQKTEVAAYTGRLPEIVKELIGERANSLKDKKINFINNLSKAATPLRCNENVLKVVVGVLLDNAIKYSRAGGQIEINGEKKNNIFELSIADRGIGIPGREHSRIFNKFFRSTNAKIVEPNGNGLGLFYSKLLLEKNGGLLWFRSKENQGSTFYCALRTD